MRPIPATSLGHAHGLLRAIDKRGRLRTDEFVTEFSLEELFPPDLENALGRLRHFISYARAAGLVKEDRGVVELTDVGRRYIRAGDAAAPFDISPQQAEWLRRQLREKHMTDSIFHGLAIGLSLLASCPPGGRVSTMDFGRSMAYLGRAGWDNENTLEIQGERHLLLLQDIEMIDGEHRLTPTGEQVRGELTLPVHMSLIDIAGQLNPGGPDAVGAAAETEWAPAPPAVEEAAPPEAPEGDNGYHTVGHAAVAPPSEPSRPPIVPRSDLPSSEPPPATLTPGDPLAASVPPPSPVEEAVASVPPPEEGFATSTPPPIIEAPPVAPAPSDDVATSTPPPVAPAPSGDAAPSVPPPVVDAPVEVPPPVNVPPPVAPAPSDDVATSTPPPVAPAPSGDVAPSVPPPVVDAPVEVSPPVEASPPVAPAPSGDAAPSAPPPVVDAPVEVPPPVNVPPPVAPAPSVDVSPSTPPPVVDAPVEVPPPVNVPLPVAPAPSDDVATSTPPPTVDAPGVDLSPDEPSPASAAAAEDAPPPVVEPPSQSPVTPVADVPSSVPPPAALPPAGVPLVSSTPPPPAAPVASSGQAFVEAWAIRAAAEAAGLRLPPSVYANVSAALTAGKHLVLTGAPGAGKTTLALAVARAAAQAGHAHGATVITAEPSRELLVEAAGRGRWVIVDELDQADADAALGPLSTFLSGVPVTLTHNEEATPADGWRIVATYNGGTPKAAVLRRFAVIEVAAPPADELRALLHQAADGDQTASRAAGRLLQLAELAPIGAGVFLDAARHAAARNAAVPTDEATLAREAYTAYVAPVHPDLDERRVDKLLKGS